MDKIAEQNEYEKAKQLWRMARWQMRSSLQKMYDAMDAADIQACSGARVEFDKFNKAIPRYRTRMRTALDAYIKAMEKIRADAVLAASASPAVKTGASFIASALPVVDFPSDSEFDPDKLKIVDANPGGSTGAKVVEVDGIKFMLKTTGGGQGVSTEHLENEVAFNNAYRAAGVYAKAGRVYRHAGKVYSLMEYIDDLIPLRQFLRKANDVQKDAVRKELLKAFPLDALFANWDVLGTDLDNVMVSKDGKRVVRIDSGSCGRFRAQGSRKNDDQWSKRSSIEDMWTMRFGAPGMRNINAGVFDGFTTEEAVGMAGIQMPAIEAAVATLPEEDRKAMAGPLAELKSLVAAKENLEVAGYTKDAVETALNTDHELHKSQFSAICPKSVSRGNYGNCRSGSGNSNASNLPPAPIPPSWDGTSYSSKIIAAAKSINYHIANGDFKPDDVKIKAALAVEKDLKKNGSPEAKQLLPFITKIKDSMANGAKDSISMVPSVDVPQSPKDRAAAKAKYKKDLADYNAKVAAQANLPSGSVVKLAFDAIVKQGGDPTFIADAMKDQGSDSWNKTAARMKVVEMSLRGDDMMSAVKNGMYDGTGHSTALKDAVRHYRNNPDEFELHKKTVAAYKAAVVKFLETTDVPGRDLKTRTVLLIRTERYDDVIQRYGVKKDEPSYYPIAPCESFGCGKVVNALGGDRRAVLVRVPFENIMGMYFWEREPGKNFGAYAGDHEQEVDADTYGIEWPKVFPDDENMSFDEYVKYYDQKIAEWTKNGKVKISGLPNGGSL